MKNIKNFIFLISMLATTQASAATISWNTSTTNVNVNDVFSLEIVGADFIGNVDGGGINISFDSNVLNILSVNINESVWDFGGLGISTGTIDNLNGSLDGLMVNTFSDITGDFVVATIEMEAIAEGSSLLALSEYTQNPWASTGSLINPDFVDATVNVSAVPLPAALWLFGSGIAGLLCAARRRIPV